MASSTYNTELGEFNSTINSMFNSWQYNTEKRAQVFLGKKQRDTEIALEKITEGKEDETKGITEAEQSPLVALATTQLGRRVLQPLAKKGFEYAGEKVHDTGDYIRNKWRSDWGDDLAGDVELPNVHDPRMVTSEPTSRPVEDPVAEQEGMDARNLARQNEAEGSGLRGEDGVADRQAQEDDVFNREWLPPHEEPPDADMEAFKRQYPQNDEDIGEGMNEPTSMEGDAKYPDFNRAGDAAQEGIENSGDLPGDATYPDFGGEGRAAQTGLQQENFADAIHTPGGAVSTTTTEAPGAAETAGGAAEDAVAGGAADVAEGAGVAAAETGLEVTAASDFWNPIGWIAGIAAAGVGIYEAVKGGSEVTQGRADVQAAQQESQPPPEPVNYAGHYISPVSSNLY